MSLKSLVCYCCCRNMSQEIMTDCYGPLKAFLDEKLRQRKPVRDERCVVHIYFVILNY